MPCADLQIQGLAIRGSVPNELLQRFTTNKAYIYFLEAFAQIITVFFFCTILDPLVTNFIDNEAAKHAVIKGYCRERAMCNLLGCFWCLCAHNGINPWMERVTSEANPSDEISRDIWDLVMDQRWTVLQLQLEPVIPILNKVAQDSVYAHKDAPRDLRLTLAKQAIPQIWRHHPALLQLEQRESCVLCHSPCPRTCNTCSWRCCSSCSTQFQGCLCRPGRPKGLVDTYSLKEGPSKREDPASGSTALLDDTQSSATASNLSRGAIPDKSPKDSKLCQSESKRVSVLSLGESHIRPQKRRSLHCSTMGLSRAQLPGPMLY